jgi:hypothetical protein
MEDPESSSGGRLLGEMWLVTTPTKTKAATPRRHAHGHSELDSEPSQLFVQNKI